jgi:hypothetical protein
MSKNYSYCFKLDCYHGLKWDNEVPCIDCHNMSEYCPLGALAIECEEEL